MSSTPELRRFDAADIEAAAQLALDNDGVALDGFIETAWNENIPIGAVFLELLQGASQSLRRRRDANQCTDQELALAMGQLRLTALRWAPRLPRRSSLDAELALLVHPPNGGPSLNSTLYGIYCDCAGWGTEEVADLNQVPERASAEDVGAVLVLVNARDQLDLAQRVTAELNGAFLAVDPTLAPSFADGSRHVLLNPGQVPAVLGRIEEANRQSRIRS